MTLVLRVVSANVERLGHGEGSRLIHWIQAGQSLTVGREGIAADVAIRCDARMSAAHFQIVCATDGDRLRDLGSQHGTFLNGRRVREADLQDGDLILAGSTTFRVELENKVADRGDRLPAAEPDIADVAVSDGELSAAKEPFQVVLRITRGPFGPVESIAMTHLLNWISPGQSLRIGRTERADVVLRGDRRLSSLHFEIVCEADQAMLRDLDSRNGTFVDGQRVSETVLRQGSRILAGDTHFEVALMGLASDSTEQGDPPAAPAPEPDPMMEPAEPLPASPQTQTGQTPLETMQVVLTRDVDLPDGWRRSGASRVVTWLGAGQKIRVGRRAASVDMTVHQDAKMSGQHFQLECDGRYCRLEDLGSRNGTFVNGRRVARTVIRDGDQILAGATIFHVAICGGSSVTDTEAEFEAVEIEDAYDTADDAEGETSQHVDLDAVFDQLKSKLRRRQ